MCDNTVDKYAHAIGSVVDCCKTQKICDKAFPSAIKFFQSKLFRYCPFIHY